MEITDVKIRMLGKKRLKAVASITFDGIISINDIKIIQAKKRLCIAYPENPDTHTDRPQYFVVPRTPEASKKIENRLLSSYGKLLQNGKKERTCTQTKKCANATDLQKTANAVNA